MALAMALLELRIWLRVPIVFGLTEQALEQQLLLEGVGFVTTIDGVDNGEGVASVTNDGSCSVAAWFCPVLWR